MPDLKPHHVMYCELLIGVSNHAFALTNAGKEKKDTCQQAVCLEYLPKKTPPLAFGARDGDRGENKLSPLLSNFFLLF